jgi:glycosyltransferase involved in cell wall biosynthesis
MRVLHAPTVVGGQSVVVAKALRKVGVEADSLQYCRKGLARYRADIDVDLNSANFLQRLAKQVETFLRVSNRYDIYHFHFAHTFLPLFLDLPVLKLLGKKIVFEYHGSDMRNPFKFVNSFCLPRKVGLLAKQSLVRLVSELFVDAEIVTTPDMLKYIPSAKHIPVAVEVGGDQPTSTSKGAGGVVTIAHAPTNRVVKGTDYVISAVDELRREGLAVEFDLIEGVAPEEVIRRLRMADIAVDQLLIGWYGIFSVEALMLGKPVVCYINPTLKGCVPDLPIVTANHISLVDVLRSLVRDEKRRRDLGRHGVEFAKRFHDSEVVGERFTKIYRGL